MALNMNDSPPCTTPADVQAELHARLWFTQGWLEGQRAKATARIECLNQLKTDPFLSSHVTNINDLSRQQAVQQRLLVNLDSVHAQLRRTIEQAQCNTLENSEDASTPQGAIPLKDTSKPAQTRVVVKRKDTPHSGTDLSRDSIDRSKGREQTPPKTGSRIQPRSYSRGLIRTRAHAVFFNTSATRDAADRVATTPKRKHDPPGIKQLAPKKRKTSRR